MKLFLVYFFLVLFLHKTKIDAYPYYYDGLAILCQPGDEIAWYNHNMCPCDNTGKRYVCPGNQVHIMILSFPSEDEVQGNGTLCDPGSVYRIYDDICVCNVYGNGMPCKYDRRTAVGAIDLCDAGTRTRLNDMICECAVGADHYVCRGNMIIIYPRETYLEATIPLW